MPGGFLVEPMHQLQEGRGAGLTQDFDHTPADAAAPVYGQTRRLVDCQQPVVLEEHRPAGSEAEAGAALERTGAATYEPEVPAPGLRDAVDRWHPRDGC